MASKIVRDGVVSKWGTRTLHRFMTRTVEYGANEVAFCGIAYSPDNIEWTNHRGAVLCHGCFNRDRAIRALPPL
jgi:hypothetical protein